MKKPRHVYVSRARETSLYRDTQERLLMYTKTLIKLKKIIIVHIMCNSKKITLYLQLKLCIKKVGKPKCLQNARIYILLINGLIKKKKILLLLSIWQNYRVLPSINNIAMHFGPDVSILISVSASRKHSLFVIGPFQSCVYENIILNCFVVWISTHLRSAYDDLVS